MSCVEVWEFCFANKKQTEVDSTAQLNQLLSLLLRKERSQILLQRGGVSAHQLGYC